MIKTLINSSVRYPIDRKRIKNLVGRILGDSGLEKNMEVSILFSGDRKMTKLNSVYRQLNKTTNVLSFPLNESKFPDGVLRLGDIIISYPQARRQAADNNVLVDEEIDRLVEHGLMSLLGLHDDNLLP